MSEKVYQQVSQAVATITRPADTVAYASGDVIADSTTAATPLVFKGVCGDGEGAVIRAAQFSSSIVPATKLNADLFLFHTAPTAYGNDNEAFALSDADLLNCVGVITLDGTTAANIKVGTLNCVVINQALAMPVKSLTTDRALYGVLVARNAYVPASAEVLTVKLGAEKA